MKTSFNLLKSVFILSLFLVFTACETEEEPLEEEALMISEIENSLLECLWASYSRVDATTRGLLFDFSNKNIIIYDEDMENVISEGTWEVENEVITFNSLNGDLENYNGNWDVARFWEGYIALKKGDMDIEFEQGLCE